MRLAAMVGGLGDPVVAAIRSRVWIAPPSAGQRVLRDGIRGGCAQGFVVHASLTRASERTVTSLRVDHRPRRFETVIALREPSVRCRSLTAGR